MIVRIRRLMTPVVLVLTLPITPAVADDESARLNAFLDEVHDARVARWPEWQTSIGLKTNNNQWNDRGEARMLVEQSITIKELTQLQRDFDPSRLDAPAELSYRLFERRAEENIAWFPYRHDRYFVSQLGGPHIDIPAFLTNRHTVDSRADAEAYIARLRGVGWVMDQAIARLTMSADKGVILPRFIFPRVLADIDGFLTGVPFEPAATADTLLLADFRAKVAKLDLPESETALLVDRAKAMLLDVVKPAYLRLRGALVALQAKATDDAGVWKFPDGAAYYARALHRATTTDMTPDEVHAYGLSEVARIQGEMRKIAVTLGFKGDLKALFDFARNDPSNFYANDEEGRAAYLAAGRAFLAAMDAKLDSVFSVRPEAALVLRRVEPFREKTAATGFYDGPSLYGHRPGTVFLNLYDMARMPKSHLEALVYHEGVPGHHMQIALARELKGIPKFRRFSGNAAFGEGWALYAERLAKEMGFYREPMSDFGRLAWELLRAARLVVDTGIHHKRWTRDQAIAYLEETLPTRHEANVESIDRYVVWPAQATAYAIGMREILALRAAAKERLGDRFELRDFHRVVLGSGALPLDLLREEVERWVKAGGG